jgi:hypothetical protein
MLPFAISQHFEKNSKFLVFLSGRLTGNSSKHVVSEGFRLSFTGLEPVFQPDKGCRFSLTAILSLNYSIWFE